MFKIVKLYMNNVISVVLDELTNKEAINLCNTLNDKYSFKNSYYTFKIVKESKEYLQLNTL